MAPGQGHQHQGARLPEVRGPGEAGPGHGQGTSSRHDAGEEHEPGLHHDRRDDRRHPARQGGVRRPQHQDGGLPLQLHLPEVHHHHAADGVLIQPRGRHRQIQGRLRKHEGYQNLQLPLDHGTHWHVQRCPVSKYVRGYSDKSYREYLQVKLV